MEIAKPKSKESVVPLMEFHTFVMLQGLRLLDPVMSMDWLNSLLDFVNGLLNLCGHGHKCFRDVTFFFELFNCLVCSFYVSGRRPKEIVETKIQR